MEQRDVEGGDDLLAKLGRAQEQPGLERARGRIEAGVEDARVRAARPERQLGLGFEQQHVHAAARQRERHARADDPAAYDRDGRAIQRSDHVNRRQLPSYACLA